MILRVLVGIAAIGVIHFILEQDAENQHIATAYIANPHLFSIEASIPGIIFHLILIY